VTSLETPGATIRGKDDIRYGSVLRLNRVTQPYQERRNGYGKTMIWTDLPDEFYN
jgi:hypothetical protein